MIKLMIFLTFIAFFIFPTAFGEIYDDSASYLETPTIWWKDGKISDSEFTTMIEFLIQEKIILVPTNSILEKSELPDWLLNNAGWWAARISTNSDFSSFDNSYINDVIYRCDLAYDHTMSIAVNPNNSDPICQERINTHGFRGIDFSTSKSDDTYRIFAVGSSTTFGNGVNNNETWPFHLQNIFDKFYPENKIEVINAGLGSSSTAMEIKLIKENISKMEPDLIIMLDGWNDDSHNISSDQTLENWKTACKFGIEQNFDTVVILQPTNVGTGNRVQTNQESMYPLDPIIKENFIYLSDNLSTLDEDCTKALDFRKIFDYVEKPVYWDATHTGTLGNQIIAKEVFLEIFDIIPQTADTKIDLSSKELNLRIPTIFAAHSNLSGKNFEHINLENAIFEYTNLQNSSFKNSNLENAILKNSNLSNVDFSNSNLKSTNFAWSELTNVSFANQDLSGANLSGIHLSNMKHDGIILTNAILSGANLSGMDFTKIPHSGITLNGLNCCLNLPTDLTNVALSDTDLSNKNLSFTNLSGQDLSKHNLENTVLTQSNLSNVRLPSENLSNKNFFKTNFSNVDLSNREIKDSNFKKSILKNANLENTNFSLSDFSEINLSEIQNDSLDTSNFSSVLFSYSNLEGLQLENSIEDSNFYHAEISERNFSNIEITSTLFAYTNLSNSNFDNTQMISIYKENTIPGAAYLHGTNLNDLSKMLFASPNILIYYAEPSGNDLNIMALSYTLFSNVDLSNSSFENTDLTNTFFYKTDLTGATFKNVNLENVSFLDSTLEFKELDCSNHEICN